MGTGSSAQVLGIVCLGVLQEMRVTHGRFSVSYWAVCEYIPPPASFLFVLCECMRMVSLFPHTCLHGLPFFFSSILLYGHFLNFYPLYTSVSLSTFPSFVLPSPLSFSLRSSSLSLSFLYALSLLSPPSPTLPYFVLLPSYPSCSPPSPSSPPFLSLSSTLPFPRPTPSLDLSLAIVVNVMRRGAVRGAAGGHRKRQARREMV